MTIDEYLEYIKRQEIPPLPPDAVLENTWANLGDTYMEQLEARNVCTSYGLWVVIADTWLKPLAEWIGDRKCLEIMAGGGWLAKGLGNHGVVVEATDDFSWEDRHSKMTPLIHVMREDAITSAQYSKDMDIMIVSWPPYGDEQGDIVVQACNMWGSERPIVYIGENSGGCNAPDEFFEHFTLDDDAPDIFLPQWWGLHDQLMIGYWNNKREE